MEMGHIWQSMMLKSEEGMRVLNENPVAVVLSDHKMPGMTGVEFLSRVRELDDQAKAIETIVPNRPENAKVEFKLEYCR